MNAREYYLGPDIEAKSALPEPLPPKIPSGTGGKAVPVYLGRTRGAKVANNSTNITNLVLSEHFRNEASMNQVIKKLVLTSPDLSHALETKIKSALAAEYIVYARSPDGRVDKAGTELAQSLVMRMNLGTHDYTKFTRFTDLRTLTANLLYDSFRYNGMMAELVLDKARMPAFLKVIPSRLIEWADDTPTTYPIYKGPNEDIPLNFPTIFYSSAIQDQETPYAESPLQTAIQACLWDADFVDDLRRAATKNLMQRMRVLINSEKYLATLPMDIRHNETKLKQHMDSTVAKLEAQLAGLNPEDSLVLFDIMDADTIADANRSEDRSINVLQAVINGKVSAGAKILPAIIGRGESSNAASTESMLFLKSVSSAQLEINILISKALTLALRLMGNDVYVHFELAEVNLRPGLELESFKSIRLASTLQLLSIGMLSDDLACIKLTGMLPPNGYKELSGTMFYKGSPAVSGNDYSNTSVSADGKTDSTQVQKDTEAK